ncbi:MAG: glycosyltransferase 87 family protein [Sulfobacillus thermotolerans]|uniref:DUF2029 domain-containing protein n=1 Tax=Sulfobacillus thermotolerans TaxID=338644 RepID=A0ABM6RUI6_9FIRM|nr:hypothetical protein BXT84_14415 [Sulfobacillus thermotolerans]MCY0908462.1 glycosyltransferase 87 family protein [Sulfobacillus thermotolerans]
MPQMWTKRHVWIAYLAFVATELWLSVHFPEADVAEYHRYAVAATTYPWFHHWPREYPALSLFIFLLPLLLPVGYRIAFAIWALAALGVMLWRGMSHHGPVWGIRLLGYLAVGTTGLFAQRYDIFAALAALLAIDYALRQKWRLAWAFSVIGFLLKLFPAVFWPVFLIQEWRQTGRWRWDRLAYSVGTGLVVVGFQALGAAHQAFTSYRYLLDRPVEIGSLAASVTAMIAHPHLFYAFGSIDVEAHGLAHGVGVFLTVTGVVAWLAVFYQQYRGRLELVPAVTYTLGILLLTTKVFSAQYLIWLAPLLAMRRGNGFLVASYALTSVGYPIGYAIPGMMPWVVYIFAARNLLLAAGLIALAVVSRSSVPAAPSTGKEHSL